MADSFDIIIAGGGMVGATLAAALGHSNLKIAVVEASEPPPFSADQPNDLRVSAISIASQKMFEAVGAWQSMLDKRACPYRRMLVWDGEKGGKTLFDSGDIYEPVLGNIIENRVIQLSIIEAIHEKENIEWISPDRISSLTENEKSVDIELDSGRQISARLLVGADGANSTVRRLCDIEVDKTPYEQHALVATVHTELPQQDITWQRYVPTGPQAFLPLLGHHASMVWYHSAEEVTRLKALSDEQFIIEMEQAFPERLGSIRAVESRGSFPLIKSHARQYVKNRVAIIGDASHTIHPQAGQGVNLGLMDAAELADIIMQNHNLGKDIGTLTVLRKYERARRGYNTAMITAMDVFYHSFRNESPPAKIARSAALEFANRISPVKRMAMKYAMGLTGHLPSLAKGKLPA